MDAAELLKRQKEYFASGATKSVDFRIHQLKTLKELLKEHEQEFVDAVYQDFKKPELETYATELGVLHDEINLVLKKLNKWVMPRKKKQTLISFPSYNYTVAEPYGSVLIIAPWNYPIQLALMPLIGAIAAGNTAVIKPSELTPNTSAVLNRVLGKWFKPELVAVEEGEVEKANALLSQNFDYIFFTGSPRVGKIVMEAAAKHLTPFTLELGGKSPCIVDETADLEKAARRIAWGKGLNAGQTCVAPDYLLVHESVQDELLQGLKEAFQEFYGDDPFKSPDYARIVNKDHFERLCSYLKDGQIYYGGQFDESELYISPTILTDISEGAKIMEEEIFGPLLPVITFKEMDEVIRTVKSKPKPLSLYIFTKNSATEGRVIEECSFGSGAVNDVVIQLSNPHLPFGGVGQSGIGSYRGKHSFDTFSHTKSIMKKYFWLDIPFRYPPYKGKLKWIKRVLK
ncbi:aldehyde dehydrogenase (NAD+) [Gracilimonas mengyeensis]|uniref:Aldehyde dehydrogenase n=2 Tax=Gracilimonas mengyeensis TaxID=1302730 RepID=A0A521EL98_9BACT|nr:aldehyde dehydrogenase (NAD+) [Gracilimonas mengyeensis]